MAMKWEVGKGPITRTGWCPKCGLRREANEDHHCHGTLRMRAYLSGVSRTDDTGKPDYTLVDWEMIDRWAAHMTKSVHSHGHNNWKNASTEEDLLRFTQSFYRHMRQWLRGETDEDHAAALIFNVCGVELVRRKIGDH